MARYKIELFGHIMYSPDLSYNDLLVREEEIKLTMQGILERAGADFIHFEALGDALRFQCVLPEEDDDNFSRICEALAPSMKNGLDGRMLLVDKDLDTLYYYTFVEGKWQEAAVALPPAGHLVAAPPVIIGNTIPEPDALTPPAATAKLKKKK